MVWSCKCSVLESQVVATAGANHTLIVNGKGELYITSGADILFRVYCNIALKRRSTLRLIFSQPTTNSILHISANNRAMLPSSLKLDR
jgi:hypothetical protein